MNVMQEVRNKLDNEIKHTVKKVKTLIKEGNITEEKLNEITNLIVKASNLNHAFTLAQAIEDPKQSEESKT